MGGGASMIAVNAGQQALTDLKSSLELQEQEAGAAEADAAAGSAAGSVMIPRDTAEFWAREHLGESLPSSTMDRFEDKGKVPMPVLERLVNNQRQ